MAKNGGQVYFPKEVHKHPLFSWANYDYDFALLKLETKLNWTDKIYYIHMPTDDISNTLHPGDPCYAVGWGN